MASKLAKSKANPRSMYWKNKADKAWGKYIHKRDEGCLVCGTTSKRTEAHHLISRARVITRHSPENGVLLCSYHHKFCPNESPHAAPLQFSEFLFENHPEKYDWFLKNRFATGVVDYEKSYYDLKKLIEGL